MPKNPLTFLPTLLWSLILAVFYSLIGILLLPVFLVLVLLEKLYQKWKNK